MKKVVISFLTIWTLMSVGLLSIFVGFPEDTTVSAITITVDDDGPADYSRIQDAINASNDGDTIYVYNGTYFEHVVVNKTVNLTGEDRNTTIIDGGESGNVIRIEKDWVNITGFKIIRSGPSIFDACVIFTNVQNCTFINNNVSSDYKIGIIFESSSKNNFMSDNKVINNRIGLEFHSSSYNYIINNHVYNNSYGINILSSSSHNTIVGNNVTLNAIFGISITGLSNNNSIMGNNVALNSARGVHVSSASYNNITGNEISNSASGIVIQSSSTWNIVNNNNLSSNDAGMVIRSSSNNNISGNNASFNNENGILLWESSVNNTIANNDFSNNSYHGINITDSSNFNQISNNNVSNNIEGIILDLSTNNTINENYAINCNYGISLYNSDGNNITKNTLYNNSRGIRLWFSDQNNIIGNIANGNNWYGIRLWYSDLNNIVENNASENGIGIALDDSIENNVSKNLAFLNILHGIILSSSDGNKVTQNEASFNSQNGIYLSSSFMNIVVNNFAFSNLYGIRLHSSDGNIISGNNISNNRKGIDIYQSCGNNVSNNKASSNDWRGIELTYSNSNNIKDNEVSNNNMGIVLVSSNMNNISGNIAQSNNLYGMDIFSSNGNNITDNYASNSPVGIVLDTSIGNNVTKNNISNNLNGIYLDNSNGNNIMDNNASNNTGGICLSESSNNNIAGNNASSNSNDGIYLVDSYDNYVFSNVVIQNGIEGIHLMNSGGNTITDNYASDNNMGIYLIQSSGNIIISNNVSKSIDGIRLSFSSGNEIIGNNATSNNVAGIHLRGSNWNTITRNNAYSNNINGIYLDLSSNNTVNNCNIYSNNFYGVGAREGAQDNYIVNSTISNSGSYDFNLYDNSSIIAINTTFDKSKVYFDDPNSTLTVKWYMHVYVESVYCVPIFGVIVEVTNLTNDPVEGSPFITEDDGFVRWIVVTEYIQNDKNGGSPGGDNKIYSTPHNVTAYLMGNTGYAKPEPVMDSSKVITIILDTEKPIADAGIDVSVDEDELYIFDGSGSSDEVGITNLTWDFGDGTFGYGETPTHTYISSGFYVVVLNVTDTAGNWDTDTVNIFVNNVQPIADAGNDKVCDEGEQISFDGSNSIDTASDINSLIYTWDFNDGTLGSGKIVNHSYEDNGTYTVTLQVTDDDGATSIDSITVTVYNTAPGITPIAPQFLQEDQLYTLQVIAIDVQGDTLTFSDNTTMFDIDPVTGVISFTPTNADGGTHLVNVTVVDDDGAESYIEIQINVQNTNDAPIITSSPLTIASENSTYYYNLTVVDEDLDSITYMLDLKPDGMNIDPNGRITWTPTYQQASQTFMVIVNVSDGDDFGTQTFSIKVMNVNDKPTITSTPVLSATEDVLYTYDFNAVDVDIGDWLIYSLDTAPIGMSIDSSTGLITWVPTNGQVGDNDVVVNVTDTSGAFVIQEFTITVANTNDAPLLEPIGPLVAMEGGTFSYIVTTVDIDAGDTLSFSDDTDLFDIDSTTGNITFIPSNDDVGMYIVRITVTDSNAAFDFENVIVTINNVNNPPSLTTIDSQTLTEDVPFTLIVTATDIDIGDTQIFLDDTTLFDINPYTGEISFTPTNEDVGTYLVNITVKDNCGSFAYYVVNITISNVNDVPSIEQIRDLTVVVGKAFSYTVMATDIDQGDTLTFSDDTEIFDIDPNTGEISFTPSEKDAGVHYVTITVTDEEGETNQTTVTFTVLEAKREAPFDYTWILLIIIVGLIAFFTGYLMRRKEEIELPREEEEGLEEPEEIEMELLEEEPIEGDEVEKIEKEFPPPPPPEEEGEDLKKEIVKQPSEDEEIFEFETIEEEGAEGLDESADSKEEGQSKKDENVEPKTEEEDLKDENTSGDKDSEESEE